MSLSLLRELHARGWTDAAIADAINEHSKELWTPFRVWYWRHKLALPARPRRPRQHRLGESRAESRNLYQTRQGWAHLLPYYDRRAREWQPGHELRPREVDVLSALRDRGPLTALAICRAIGRRDLSDRGSTYTARLILAGLVVCEGHPPVYHLAGAAAAQRAPRRPTGIEAEFS